MKPSCFNQGFWLEQQQQQQRELWNLGSESTAVLWHPYKIHKYFLCNYMSSWTSNIDRGCTCRARCSRTSRTARDPKTKWVFQILIGFESASSNVMDHIVIETAQWIELHHVVLTLSNEVERASTSSQDTSKLGWMAKRLSNCEIIDSLFCGSSILMTLWWTSTGIRAEIW